MTLSDFESVFVQSEKPLYLALADRLTEAIEDKDVEAHAKLPTHRDLAGKLGVNIGTVTRAYRELERRGLVSAEVGRGTFVRPDHAGGLRHDFGRSSPADTIDMAYNLPPVFSAREERRFYRDALESLAGAGDLLRVMHYHFPQTSTRHREAGCRWLLQCGVAAEPAEITLAAGSQHALFLALLTLCRPGDTVLAESLTYPGMKMAAEALHLRVVGLPLDDEGLLPDALASACAQGARVLYTVPTVQNPTTGTLSPGRREAIIAIARRSGVTVIEDDIHGRLAQLPAQPLSALYPEGGWYIANLGKTLAPSLRVSYMRTPAEHAEMVARHVMTTQWMASPLGARLASFWIENGTAEKILAARKQEAVRRLDIAKSILGCTGARIPTGGYHLWLPLPSPWRAEDFRLRALRKGVAVNTAEIFSIGPALPQAIRVCLGGAESTDTLRQGLTILRGLLAESPMESAPVF